MSRNEGTIEDDKEYLKFCAELEKSQETKDNDPATSSSAAGATATTATTATEGPSADDTILEKKVVITPLMEFIRRQRESKLKSKSKSKGKQNSVCPAHALSFLLLGSLFYTFLVYIIILTKRR